MSKTFDPSLLSGYLDGELEAEEKALVERVLDEQPERRRQLDDLKRLQQSLATLPAPQPTRDPVESVRQRIDQRQSSTVTSSHRWWLHLTSLALAACLLLAVGWAIFGGSDDAPQVASEGSPEAGSEMSVQSQTMLAPQPPASEPPAREPAVQEEAAERFDSMREREATRPRADAPQAQPRRDGRSVDGVERFGDAAVGPDGEADQATMLDEPKQALNESLGRARSSRAMSAPAAELRQRTEPAAPMQLRHSQEEPPAAMAMSAAGSPGEPLRANIGNAIVLRYVIPASEQAETVRWLHEIAPQDVVALPSVGLSEAGDVLSVPQTERPIPTARGEASSRSSTEQNRAADVTEDSVGDLKRLWFRGDPAEQRALRLAIENRAKATKAQLKIVRPNEAAPQTWDMQGADAAMKKSRNEELADPDAPESDQVPTGILIELIVRPTP